MEKDIICGMDVDPKKTGIKATYKNKTYYFCSPGCKAAFEKEPDKYVAP
ncbi:MAG: YHS domain-containing protein [Spirochaetales bacterium]|nr:YHS domain-containing protein [Spirochaetales bacterium]